MFKFSKCIGIVFFTSMTVFISGGIKSQAMEKPNYSITAEDIQHLEEKTIESKETYKCSAFSVNSDRLLLPDGKQRTREIINRQGASCIAALTPKNELIFIKQYRHPYKKVLFELPAGKLDGNEPLECAIRELEEETGIIGKNFSSLGEVYPTVGFLNEVIYLFSCEIGEVVSQKLNEGEFVKVIRIPLQKAYEMVINGEIKDAKTQIAVLKLYSKMSKVSE